MQKQVKLVGGTPWNPVVGWDLDVHPWMSAYCGFFALAMKEVFPEVSFAVQYSGDRAVHGLVVKDSILWDARGCLGEQAEGKEYRFYLSEAKLRASGLLLAKRGVRELPEAIAVEEGKRWIKQKEWHSLYDIPRIKTQRPFS